MALPSHRPRTNPAPETAPEAAPDALAGRQRTAIALLLGAHAFILALIVLAMTPLTHNLDDIKILLFLGLGPLLALGSLACLGLGAAPPPPRLVAIGLGGYLLVVALSTALSEFSWIGKFYIQFYWVAAGFFLSAMCLGSRRWSLEIFLRFLLVMVLATNLIGLFMYDLTGHGSGVRLLYWLFYGDATAPPTHMQRLLNTLQSAEGNMQATILNRDFYAAFCLLYLPFAILMLVDPGPGRRPNLWRGLGALTMVLTLVSIFLCKSKGEYLVAVVVLAFCGAMYALRGRVRGIRPQHMLALMVGLTMLLGTLAIMRSPTILNQLKGLDVSVQSREIIWTGSYKIFQDHPVIGGGPGTFRILFPEYRRADYFNHEISNVTIFSHNIFLDLLAETGLLGFGFFMLMLGSIWLGGFYYALRHPDPRLRNIMIACLTALLGIYGSNLSSPNGRWVIGAVGLWTVMGLTCGVLLLARVPGQKTPIAAAAGPPRKPVAVAAIALLALGLVMGGFGARTGLNYFNSARTYAAGLAYMEEGLKAVERGLIQDEQVRERVIDYLRTSYPLLESSIKTDPNNLSAYYKLGSVYTTLYQLVREKAISAANRQRADQEAEFRQLSGIYLKLARARFDQLAALSPNYAEIHYNLGLVNKFYASYLEEEAARTTPEKAAEMQAEAERSRKAARAALDKMAQMSQKPEVALIRGRQYDEMGLSEQAIQIFREATALYPDHRDLAIGFYQAAAAIEDPRAQAEALELVWRQSPNEAEVLSMLLRLALEGDHQDLIERTLARLEELNPIDPRLFEVRMVQAERAGDQERYITLAEQYLNAGGNAPEFVVTAQRMALALGQDARASRLRTAAEAMGAEFFDSPTTFTQPAAEAGGVQQ